MAAGKYIVTKELHIRKAAPRLLRDNVAGVLYPNFVIDAVDEVAGDSYSDQYINSDIWLKDGNGFYYWKGGIQGFDGLGPAGTKTINYNTLINIPEHIKETKGKEVVIAIVDTGCYKHPALNDAIKAGHNWDLNTGDATNWNDTSNLGHGTRVAGIIASNGVGSSVTGVAPEAKILVVRVASNKTVTAEPVIKALEWLLDDSRTDYIKPDIINLSLEFWPGTLEKQFSRIFSTIRSREIWVFAAAPEGAALFSTGMLYPARDNNVLSVGALNRTEIPAGIDTNPTVNYLLPNNKLLSPVNFGLPDKELSGSSFSTALLSGTMALYISYNRLKKSISDPLDMMNLSLPRFNRANFNEVLKIYLNENGPV